LIEIKQLAADAAKKKKASDVAARLQNISRS
jgi:hypothetical protein